MSLVKIVSDLSAVDVPSGHVSFGVFTPCIRGHLLTFCRSLWLPQFLHRVKNRLHLTTTILSVFISTIHNGNRQLFFMPNYFVVSYR